MRLVLPAFLAEPPREPDVAVIGAGAAGIAAARLLLSRGLTVAVIEARPHPGGRCVTAGFRGHPVDLGAHWLHAGPINPLVKLGFARGERLRRAPQQSHLVVGRRFGTPAEERLLGRAFDLADRALTRAAKAPEDRPAAKALPLLGPWGERVARVHGLVSGRPLPEVSLHDFPSMEYGDNFFIHGGFGAYLARLAQGLPIRLGTPARRIDWSGAGVRVETDAGTIAARAAIVTVPMAVLQAGGLRFAPELPAETRDAVEAFRPGIYEHVILHWPGAPFRGPDRLASVVGGRLKPPGLLTRIDGTPFHYFELDQPSAARLDRRDPHAPARYAREVLADHFGARSLRDLAIPHATEWRHDPWSRASWAVVPPGRFPIREAIKAPMGDRIWFAGEAGSRLQWGTVGGAWDDGVRAADAAAEELKH